MHKHKLIELRKIIEEKIGLLIKEVGNVTNVKLNALYIVDRKDEVEFLTMDHKNYSMGVRSN